jgi:hypothetical protein
MKRQTPSLRPIKSERIRRLRGPKSNPSRRNQDAELTTIKPLPFTIIECRAAIQSKSLVVCVMTGGSSVTAVKASRVPIAGILGANAS